ncbi:GH25 family lysozyme (plasmid) [Ligilactobacillus equi]
MSYNLVADVSSYQPDSLAFFQALKSKGVKAVIVKLTEGTTYINPKAQNQINCARSAGLLVHGYHFARFVGTMGAQAEASFFLQQARAHSLDQASVLALDYEDPRTGHYNANNDINAFLQVLLGAGYKVDLYSMASWWQNGYIDPAKVLAKNKWVANYGVSQPGLDDVGTWQYTASFPVNGVNVDMSYDFHGYYTEGKAAQVVAMPVTASSSSDDQTFKDTRGVTWHKESGSYTCGVATYLRWGATTHSATITLLAAGSTIKYDAYCFADGFVWLRQPRANGTYGYLASGQADNNHRLSSWGTFK